MKFIDKSNTNEEWVDDAAEQSCTRSIHKNGVSSATPQGKYSRPRRITNPAFTTKTEYKYYEEKPRYYNGHLGISAHSLIGNYCENPVPRGGVIALGKKGNDMEINRTAYLT